VISAAGVREYTEKIIMLYKRVISSLLFLPIFYLVTWRLSPEYFTALVLIAVAVGQYEFYRMARVRGINPNTVLGSMIGALIVLEFYRPVLTNEGTVFFITGCMLLIMVSRLFSRRPAEGAMEDIASTILGVFYVSVLFAFQVWIITAIEGRRWILFLYFVIWASDIGAYAIGMPFGKHRLYEKISPKKSIEGLLGALAASSGVALLWRVLFMPSVGPGEAVMLGLILTVVGTLGDLTESLLKRASGVKDSGGIIPGHGGILDRMDSMLFAAPVLYYYLRMR
jgi:phosphatidate cytidylyltransferase